MNIGKAIKEVRKEKGLSQGDFAEKCEITQGSISQIETGLTRPNPATLKKICEVLNIPEVVLQIKALEPSDIPANKKQDYEDYLPIMEKLISRLLT